MLETQNMHRASRRRLPRAAVVILLLYLSMQRCSDEQILLEFVLYNTKARHAETQRIDSRQPVTTPSSVLLPTCSGGRFDLIKER